MTAPEQMKACPFCGGEAVRCFHVDNPTRIRHWILCRTCHASPGDRLAEAEAIAAWNTRPATDELVEALEKIANYKWPDIVGQTKTVHYGAHSGEAYVSHFPIPREYALQALNSVKEIARTALRNTGAVS